MGESKIFGTHTTKKTPRHIVCIFLVGHWITWAKNADIWPKMSVLDQIWTFWAKNPNPTGGSTSFGTHITQKPPRHLVCIGLLVMHWIKWAKNAHI